MKILTCTCCGAEITAPQFFNGKPYGWTCIKKVCPTQKQSKMKYVPVESYTVGSMGPFHTVTFKFEGKKYTVRSSLSDKTEGMFIGGRMIDNVFYAEEGFKKYFN